MTCLSLRFIWHQMTDDNARRPGLLACLGGEGSGETKHVCQQLNLETIPKQALSEN
jgi:hypothetical protein